MKNLLGQAIFIAATAHRDQKDKGGKAYILHPLRLMMRLRTDDEELMQIAVLHDVFEDHGDVWCLNDLAVRGFSDRVINALRILTHKKDQSYHDYIMSMVDNHDCIRVKIEDLRDNSDIMRLKGISEKDNARIEKYHKYFLILQEAGKKFQ